VPSGVGSPVPSAGVRGRSLFDCVCVPPGLVVPSVRVGPPSSPSAVGVGDRVGAGLQATVGAAVVSHGVSYRENYLDQG